MGTRLGDWQARALSLRAQECHSGREEAAWRSAGRARPVARRLPWGLARELLCGRVPSLPSTWFIFAEDASFPGKRRALGFRRRRWMEGTANAADGSKNEGRSQKLGQRAGATGQMRRRCRKRIGRDPTEQSPSGLRSLWPMLQIKQKCKQSVTERCCLWGRGTVPQRLGGMGGPGREGGGRRVPPGLSPRAACCHGACLVLGRPHPRDKVGRVPGACPWLLPGKG